MVEIKMGKNSFVSYRADDEGSVYKNLLVAWSKNDNGYFDNEFEEKGLDSSYEIC